MKIAPFPLLALLLCAHASAQVVINEIHYHPVEKPAFDASGNPVFQGTSTVADFTDDVHEFVELYNAGLDPVNVGNWKLGGGIGFTIPGGTMLLDGQFLVVAKNPARIQSVYGITGVLGPYSGKLGNSGDTVKLDDAGGAAVDSMRYESVFPWAISANALGANDDFTGLASASYQYKGRSLQRVSATASSSDPANWVAAPAAIVPATNDLPTPGLANVVTRAVPKPVLTALSALQGGSTIIRSTGPTTVTCSFSSSASLSNVQLEYFIDNFNAWGESRTTVTMTSLGNNQFTATIPAQADRSIIRYRIKADRGDGAEVVSPRGDDPRLVPVNWASGTGFTREPWHAAFVTPVRSSAKPIYDCFISTDGQALSDTTGANVFPFTGLNGLQTLGYNAMGNLKRVVASSLVTTTYPRELGWPGVTANDRIWNGTVPGVFVENGSVRDIQIRFHGSRYNRRPSRKSYKLLFTDYQKYLGADSIFITDKGDDFATGHGLHRLAGLPISHVRYVDWYLNSDALQTRLEQGEYNGDLLEIFHAAQQRTNPGSQLEETGELYKAVGVIQSNGNATVVGGNPSGGEGPYGTTNAWQLPATGGSPSWTELQRFDYSFTLQNHAWVGPKPVRDMVTGMWTARGDAYNAINPNIANTRAWIQANWDVDTELTSLALGNWMCPWDDTTQNHYYWRRLIGRDAGGAPIYRWARFLWDFDGMYGASAGALARDSIYLGEVGDPGNNFRGPHYTKDSFLKAFRTEYKQKLWFLNNTLLDPENLQTLSYGTSSGGTNTFYSQINAKTGGTFGGTTYGFAVYRFLKVNEQTGLGTFYKPTRPTATAPASAAAVLPPTNLVTSAYAYNATYSHTAAPVTSPHTSSKWEIRAVADTYDNPTYVVTSTANLTSLPIPFDRLTFGQIYFWRVTYFDADGHPSITSAERSFSFGPTSTGSSSVVLNEVLADNRRAVTTGSSQPDYIELYNTTGSPVNLSGWTFTDDVLNPSRYAFPNVNIPANGRLVVWCDDDFAAPGLHTGFGLSADGQLLALLQSGVVKDTVTFGPQAADWPIGRTTDGSATWGLVNPSPNMANSAAATGPVSGLRVNEWMASPRYGDDWFELHNTNLQPVPLGGLLLSDTPGTPALTTIPPLSFIAARGFTKFQADDQTGGNHAAFKLGINDSIILSQQTGGTTTTLHSVSFSSQSFGVSEGWLPDGSIGLPRASFQKTASPGAPNWLPSVIFITEALSNSPVPLEDYVELHNSSGAIMDIGGWWLSDDQSQLQKYQIPAGTMLGIDARLVISESQLNAGANPFSLSSSGDEIILTAVNPGGSITGYRSQFKFGAAADGVSFGRVTLTHPYRDAEFWPQMARTQGNTNAPPLTTPVVINEVHYHPPDISGDDNAQDEFIELHNVTTQAVALDGWRIKGGPAFTFAAGATLRPGDYILVVGFNPETEPAALSAFRAKFGLSTSVPIYGSFAPKLPNNESSVELAFPGVPVNGVTPYILADKADYNDLSPWPTAADGTGSSLQRTSRTMIGNDPANWSAPMPTPGAVNSGQSAISDNDGDGMSNAWEDANGFDRFSAADATLDTDNDSESNLEEFIAGTNPRNSADVLQAEIAKPLSGSGFLIRFIAQAGKSYTIEFKNSLSDAQWQKLVDIAAPASQQVIEHTDATGGSNRFYRVVTPQRP